MNRLQQAWVWLRRIGHCRGFGIQSPSDYRFVRYVVNEHWPYYAYAELGRTDDWLRRKLGLLYVRLANELQPATVSDLVGVEEYVLAGCRKAKIGRQLVPSPDLLIAPAGADVEQLLSSCGEQSVLVVEDIGRRSQAWNQLLADGRTIVTFDLYYCGIAFFDKRRSRQHYIVNF